MKKSVFTGVIIIVVLFILWAIGLMHIYTLIGIVAAFGLVSLVILNIWHRNEVQNERKKRLPQLEGEITKREDFTQTKKFVGQHHSMISIDERNQQIALERKDQYIIIHF